MSSLLPIFVSPQNGPNAIGANEPVTESLGKASKEPSKTPGSAFPPAFSHILQEHEKTPALLKHLQALISTRSPDDSEFPRPLAQKDFRSLEILGYSEAVETILGELPAPRILRAPEGFHPPISVSDKVLQAGSVSQQVPLPKVAESGLVPQPVPQGVAVKHDSLGLDQRESLLTRTIAPPVQDVSSGLRQVGRLVQEDEALKFPVLQRLSSPLVRSQALQPNHTAPVTAIQTQGPAGFTEQGLTDQFSLKPISGNSAILNDLSGSGAEHRTSVRTDLLGESGSLPKGDRVQTIVETSIKSVGLDPSGGQGLGSGMNHSPNSQSGFQQPSSFPGQGVGLRALEERGQEFPAPALQRLQMDVQLSENQRVHIDVGVHNRQVYTGLIMDHSVLRTLATQFVPQLEHQLADVDLELQEFSAEVREEREQEADSLFDNSQSHKAQESRQRSESESQSTLNPLSRQGEHGLHLVA